jgi:hypothetical protein
VANPVPFPDSFAEEYENLPQAVKAVVSPKEYAWMGAEQRARLLSDICEPDVEEP